MEIDELQAGRELDALVAEEVMGWHSITRWADGEISGRHKQADHQLIELPHYSTDIVAAWEVVQVKRLHIGPLPIDWDTEGWYCTDNHDLNKATIFHSGKTAPLAICKAALKAIGCSAS